VTLFAPIRTCAVLLLCLYSLSPKLAFAGMFSNLFADEQPLEVQIADPYIELHSGPGNGYPVFHVEEQDAWVEILKRKTDWFKVRTTKGKQGWVPREQLERTLTPAGDYTDITDATKKEFSFHRWEMGAMGGDFENSDVMTVYGGFFFTPKFSAEVSASKIFADFSDADMANISLSIHPFPEWRLSPFFTLGTGVIKTDPKTTLVQESDSTDQLAHAGAGSKALTTIRRLMNGKQDLPSFSKSGNSDRDIGQQRQCTSHSCRGTGTGGSPGNRAP
jgi:hypothetical protein